MNLLPYLTIPRAVKIEEVEDPFSWEIRQRKEAVAQVLQAQMSFYMESSSALEGLDLPFLAPEIADAATLKQ